MSDRDHFTDAQLYAWSPAKAPTTSFYGVDRKADPVRLTGAQRKPSRLARLRVWWGYFVRRVCVALGGYVE